MYVGYIKKNIGILQSRRLYLTWIRRLKLIKEGLKGITITFGVDKVL